MAVAVYVGRDLALYTAAIPDPPLSLWVTPAGAVSPVPAALLTPLVYARCWQAVAALEEDHWKCKYPADKWREALTRLAPLTTYAEEEFCPAELADALLLAVRGHAPPLPHPEFCLLPDVFADTVMVFDGRTGRFHEQKATMKGQRVRASKGAPVVKPSRQNKKTCASEQLLPFGEQ